MSAERLTRVTSTDIESGESESIEIGHDYVLVTSGDCYVAHTAAHANGTHVVTIKGRRPDG